MYRFVIIVKYLTNFFKLEWNLGIKFTLRFFFPFSILVLELGTLGLPFRWSTDRAIRPPVTNIFFFWFLSGNMSLYQGVDSYKVSSYLLKAKLTSTTASATNSHFFANFVINVQTLKTLSLVFLAFFFSFFFFFFLFFFYKKPYYARTRKRVYIQGKIHQTQQ